jgi:hypothetical protein
MKLIIAKFVTTGGRIENACLPFRDTIFTEDMFTAQKNRGMHLLLAYSTHVSSSSNLSAHTPYWQSGSGKDVCQKFHYSTQILGIQ